MTTIILSKVDVPENETSPESKEKQQKQIVLKNEKEKKDDKEESTTIDTQWIEENGLA